jgi:integrase
MRNQGRVYQPTKGSAWWTDFQINGRRYRQSTRTRDYDEALCILAERRHAIEIGAPPPSETVPTTIAAFVEEHLRAKREHEQLTEGWLDESRHQLDRAIEHFGAGRQLASITAEDVLAFDAALKAGSQSGGRRLQASTRRHHLNTLSNLFAYALFKRVAPLNPVAAIPPKRKPRGDADEALWLEPSEAALYLEAARAFKPERHAPGQPPMPFTYPLVATLLLTGGRQDEVLGLEAADIDFDRKQVAFRPNEWRRLKTAKSQRTVPLWPQLERILRSYVFGSDSPPARLLFPSYRTGAESMLTDVRKLLDRVTELAGTLYVMDRGRKRKAEPGDIRTKVFRHTYISARLQTLDHGAPVAAWTVAREVGHSSTAMIEKTYGHLGQVRHRAKVVEYRVRQHRTTLNGRRLNTFAATSGKARGFGKSQVVARQ